MYGGSMNCAITFFSAWPYMLVATSLYMPLWMCVGLMSVRQPWYSLSVETSIMVWVKLCSTTGLFSKYHWNCGLGLPVTVKGMHQWWLSMGLRSSRMVGATGVVGVGVAAGREVRGGGERGATGEGGEEGQHQEPRRQKIDRLERGAEGSRGRRRGHWTRRTWRDVAQSEWWGEGWGRVGWGGGSAASRRELHRRRSYTERKHGESIRFAKRQ